MLSAHQIYKENTEATTIKSVKANAGIKPKGLGLKNATNICRNEKSKNANSMDPKKKSDNFKENILKPKQESCSKVKQTPAVEVSEEWPEIENMYIYNDSDDDYEDILPKSRRITKAEIDASFITCHIQRYSELPDDDKLPSITLETVEDCGKFRHFPIIESDLFWDDYPLELAPIPDILSINFD